MSGPRLFDRVKDGTTTTGTGTLTLANSAPTGFRTFGSVLSSGDTCFYCAELNAEWEVGIGTYTSAGTTLARTTVLASSNGGAAVNFSAGTKNVFMPAPAGIFDLSALTETSVPALTDTVPAVVSGIVAKQTLTRHFGLLNHVCQGRLTLSTGNPVYNPQSATPSATDTTAETCDFAAAHGWTTGTICTVSATGGGLTAGTTYWINAVDSDTVSFHTTLANAEAGTSKINLTASITAQVQPYGVQSTTVRFAPYNGNLISVHDGTRWRLYTFSELSLALGTVTSGLPYDIFVYDNSGTLTLELLAWTSGTTRATALTTQDGVYVKSGATTRRYLGTIYTVSTAATEDSAGGVVSQVGGKRFVWNAQNRESVPFAVFDGTSSWTYSTAAFRQMNAAGGNKAEIVAGLPVSTALVTRVAVAGNSTASQTYGAAIGYDSTTAKAGPAALGNSQSINVNLPLPVVLTHAPAIGYHYYAPLEYGTGSGTTTWQGDSTTNRVGLWGTWQC